ncbi:MAG: Maf family protein [Patescibacteria group bacterium]|nr:Maf family protein [Patescibacteria group bacterium]
MKQIVLASKSPRRKALLKQIGLKFVVDVSDFKEDISQNLSPNNMVKQFSLEKAKNVSKRHKNSIIIACDTVIVLNNEIIGKPKTSVNATRILEKLSGKMHKVITGFTVIDSESGRSITKTVETKVYFKRITKKEIDWYVSTGEPLDKAGAYGIQEKGALFVKKIDGDYFNVVGLPIFSVIKEVNRFKD